MNKLIVKWLSDKTSFGSCGYVRGVVPAMQINNAKLCNVDVKDVENLLVSDFPGTDIMVLQRLVNPGIIDLCRKARHEGIRLVFDVDDAFWLCPDNNKCKEYEEFQLCFPPKLKELLLHIMSEEVDMVTCSTPELAVSIKEFGVAPYRIAVMENRIDPQLFTPKTNKVEKSTIDLVWYAAMGHNVNSIGLDDILSIIFQEFSNVRMHFFGGPTHFPPLQNLVRFGNRVLFHDWVPYMELGNAIHKFDIALCPIMEKPFTICKSEIKAVETSMAGLIPVMSNVPQYRRYTSRVLRNEEKELLVENTTESWVTTLRKLLNGELQIDTSDLMTRVGNVYSVAKSATEWSRFYQHIKTGSLE